MVGHSTAADLIEHVDADERSVDTVFDLLADERRRHVLSALAGSEDSLRLPDLAEAVALRESDAPLDGISPQTVHDVALALHHVHLPKLEAGDAIEYDADSDLVELSHQTTLTQNAADH